MYQIGRELQYSDNCSLGTRVCFNVLCTKIKLKLNYLEYVRKLLHCVLIIIVV